MKQKPIQRGSKPVTTRSAAASTLWMLIGLAAAGAATATLFGFAGRWWWGFDLFASFRPHCAAVLVIVAVAYLARRRRAAGALSSAFAIANIAVIAPLYWGDIPARHAASQDAPQFRILTFNVNGSNDRHTDIARYIAHSDADVVALLEVRRELAALLEAELPGYQAFGKPRDDNFGILVLSRLPVLRRDIVHMTSEGIPAIDMALMAGGVEFSLLAVHTMPPVGAAAASLRQEAFAEMTAWTQQHTGERAAIVGDFNATPWSAPFVQLLAETGWHNSMRGFGVQVTWPAGLGPLGIPIDHCVHSPALSKLARARGPFIGSDHRPVKLTLSLSRAPFAAP